MKLKHLVVEQIKMYHSLNGTLFVVLLFFYQPKVPHAPTFGILQVPEQI